MRMLRSLWHKVRNRRLNINIRKKASTNLSHFPIFIKGNIPSWTQMEYSHWHDWKLLKIYLFGYRGYSFLGTGEIPFCVQGIFLLGTGYISFGYRGYSFCVQGIFLLGTGDIPFGFRGYSFRVQGIIISTCEYGEYSFMVTHKNSHWEQETHPLFREFPIKNKEFSIGSMAYSHARGEIGP